MIADDGWNDNREQESWPPADLEDELSLVNSNSGIALRDNVGNIRDAVGWGDAAKIAGPLFYEGTPHQGVAKGQVLVRTQDSGDNSQDFVVASPTLSSTAATSIPFTITVLLTLPTIETVTLPDDKTTVTGNQIMPLANRARNIELIVATDADNVTASLLAGNEKTASPQASAVKLTTLNSTHFSGNLSLAHTAEPGDYRIFITASNERGTVEDTVTFTLLPLLAFSVDDTPFIAEIVQNSAKEHTTQITNIGNVAINTDMWITENLFNVSYKQDAGTYLALDTTPITTQLDLVPGRARPLVFSFNITDAVAPATYSGVIHLSASSRE